MWYSIKSVRFVRLEPRKWGKYMAMDSLWEPALLGPLQLRNRTVRSATNEHLAEGDGQVSEALIACYEELAKHGVGLVITGHFSVAAEARTDLGQPLIYEATDRELLRRAVGGVHRQGGKIVMQISHGGRKTSEAVSGYPPREPDSLSEEELWVIRRQFVRAAQLAGETGFDGVQVHGAHGYLLSDFHNPKENRRSDSYGGDLANRFRLTGEILRGIRKEMGPDFALLLKVNGNDGSDFPALLQLAEEAGADAVEISGLDFTARKTRNGEPYYLREWQTGVQAVAIPLILVGGLHEETAVRKAVEAGVPFLSFCRPLICQPDFLERLQRGEEGKCTSCNQCFKIYTNAFRRCAQHREENPQLRKTYS